MNEKNFSFEKFKDYILSKEEILSIKQPAPPKVSGLYFLIKGATILYVGKSKNIYDRVKQQSQDNLKDFDSFSILECPPEIIDDLEAYYIYKLRPPFNVSLPENDKFKSLREIKKMFRVREYLLKRWMLHKGLDFRKDGFYLLDSFDEFKDFLNWVKKEYPHLPTMQYSIEHLNRFINERKNFPGSTNDPTNHGDIP